MKQNGIWKILINICDIQISFNSAETSKKLKCFSPGAKIVKSNTVTVTVQLETIFPEFSNFQWKASLPYLGMLFLFNN